MFSQMSPRERLVLAVGAVFVLATLVWFALIAPYRAALSDLDRKIATRQQQLVEMQTLRQQYMQLQQQLTAVQQQLGQDSAFSIFSFIEGLAIRHVGRENLVNMRPQPATEREGFREEAVEVRLERIALNQLVQLLYELETADKPLQIKSLRVKTRFDDRRSLDSVLTVAAYGPIP